MPTRRLMDELDRTTIADAPPATLRNVDTLIASLRAAGADRFSPVRWRYLEVLAKRATAHEGSIRRMLDVKLAQELSVFKDRFDQAQGDAQATITQSVQLYPHAAKDLQRLFDAGDFKGLLQLVATLKNREQCASLSALVRQLEQHAPRHAEAPLHGIGSSRPELKAIRNFRDTWSKLSTDKQLAQALEQAPANAGPINSHMLVLRSLALMRDISPDYLNRFMTYADTLLSLDQGEAEKPGIAKQSIPKKAQAAKKTKK